MKGIQSGIFICLFGMGISSSALAQSNSVSVALIADTAAPKKTVGLPAFEKFNPDTIQLGENDRLVSDSYTALGQPYVYDALHSFNRRRMDHFGGFLNEKIDAELAEVRNKGFYSDLKKLYIQIDPATLTVYWSAVVGPSTDGLCYMHVDSRGSAGGGLSAVEKQCPRMHNIHADMVPVKLLEFNDDVLRCYDWNGAQLDSVAGVVNIQQHFYKYYDPKIGNTAALQQETANKEVEKVCAPVAVSTPKKTTTPAVTYKKYTVKQGDTLSEIAEKYHTTATKIKKANGLRSDMIRIGQVLKIPK